MRDFPPSLQQRILEEYRARARDKSFATLALRFGVPGGKRTVQRWYSRWDGTVASLCTRPRSGRPRALSAVQVARHITAPIRAANRAHRAIHYTTVFNRLPPAVRARVSLRTVQRVGKAQGAKRRRTIKRTDEESECTRKQQAGVVQVKRSVWLTAPLC